MKKTVKSNFINIEFRSNPGHQNVMISEQRYAAHTGC